MRAYLARRALLAVPTLIFVSVLVFSLMHLMPGDAVIARLQEVGVVTDASIDAMRRELGLDQPFYQQLGGWLWGLARGDLGRSLWTREPAAERLWAAIPISAELALGGLTLAVLIAVPWGAFRRPPGYLDGLSGPVFCDLGYLIARFLGRNPAHSVLFVSLGVSPSSGVYLTTRRSSPQPPTIYLTRRRARLSPLGSHSPHGTGQHAGCAAPGLRAYSAGQGNQGRAIVYRHALKNALIPVLTILGTQLSTLLGGTVILETLFSLPGVGFLTFSSIGFRDYPQIQANVLFLSAVLVMLNLLVDLSYSWLDPRIRYQ